MADIERLFEVYPSSQQATIPHGIRVNDTVYAGGIAGVDTVTGEPAGDLKAQMELALAHVKTLVEKAGGTLDNVARCVGYVTNIEARGPVYEPWDALFPDPADRPAFKALVTELPPGHLVHLDVLALLGERRTRIDIPNVPARDPSVKIGNWFFTSRCHGHDPATGEIVEGGLEAETLRTLNNIVTLTELAGGSESDLRQVTMFGRDDSYFAAARRVFEERFPNLATRPTLHQLVTFVTLTFQISIEGTALLSHGGGEPFEEIYLCPESRCIPAGVRLGGVAVAPLLTPAHPCTNDVVPGGLAEQTRATLVQVDAFLEAASLTRDEVARVTFFLSDLTDRKLLNPPWEEWFPDPKDRTPHKYVRAELTGGMLVAAQLIAVPGKSRRVLEVPGLVHQDPMSLGTVMGNLLTTSRVFAGQPGDDVDAQTALVFSNVEALLKQASAGYANVQQVTAFIGDAKFEANVRSELQRYVDEQGGDPVLNVLVTDLGGPGFPRLEIIALV